MKNLINAILRLLVKVALHGYFKKIIVEGKENIPKNRPVILVANHQNALIDPLLLATHTNLNPWFLTRAAVFSNPIAAKLLHFIRMLPVYRLRDGFSPFRIISRHLMILMKCSAKTELLSFSQKELIVW